MVYRTPRNLIRQARLTRTRAATGAVTLIQRFSIALNLNTYFRMLSTSWRLDPNWVGLGMTSDSPNQI